MQRDTERNSTAAQQAGSGATRQFVSNMQAEALYVSFLLTGERQAAIALTETAFLQFFDRTSPSEIDADRRTQLLLLIGKLFLRGDYKERIEHDVPDGLFGEPAPARFGVDNRRTLLLAALGRLTERERLALVLNDLGGLDSTALNTLLERRNEPLVAPVETARQRVRQSVDIPPGEPLRPVLVEATFDAPRINLWPRLEEPLTEIERRQKQQSRYITYGIVGAVLVVLLAGGVALFSDELFSGSESNGEVGAQVSEQATALPADPAPTLAPPVLEPTATPEQSGFPAANVPGWLMVQTVRTDDDEPDDRFRSLTRYYPEQRLIRSLSINDIRLATGSSSVQLSPDGYQMTLFREELSDSQIRYSITSFATDSSFGLQWENELLVVERDPDAPAGFNNILRLEAAITGDHVYAAVLTTDISPSLSVHAFARRNGMPRGTLDIELPVQTIDTRTFPGNIYLYAPPTSDRLYLVLESFGDPAKGRSTSLFMIDRTTLEIIERSVMATDPMQEFWFADAQPTIDGSALYGLHDWQGSLVQMRFLDFQTGERTTIDLPFMFIKGYRNSGVASILSHDGRTMYLVDWASSTVAAIDLVERRLERLFPLDLGDFAGQVGDNTGRYLIGYESALSADGTQIYLAVTDQDSLQPGSTWQSGIWVIDTATWRVVNHLPIEGFLDRIHLAPAENAIYVQTRVPTETAQTTVELVKVQTTGQLQVIDRVEIPAGDVLAYSTISPASIYRSQYSHSPAIAGIELTGNDTFATLPRLDVTTRPAVLAAGQQATVEVRVIDPASGEVLTGDRPDVRFDSTSGVTAVVDAPNGDRQFLVLGQAEPGVYRGSLTVPVLGRSTVDVVVTSLDGQTWSIPQASQIDVVPSYAGSDGRAYLFEVSIEPVEPALEKDTPVALRVIDAETGEPMPDDVTLTGVTDAPDSLPPGGLPEQIDVGFRKGDEGTQTVTLSQTSHSLFEGIAQFWSLGVWSAEIMIQPEGQPRTTIPANTIEVGA